MGPNCRGDWRSHSLILPWGFRVLTLVEKVKVKGSGLWGTFPVIGGKFRGLKFRVQGLGLMELET